MTVSFVYIISLRQSVFSAVNNFFGFTDDEMSSVGFTWIGVAAVAVVIFCTISFTLHPRAALAPINGKTLETFMIMLCPMGRL